jgi:ferredoxin-NADP reductase
VTDRLTDPVVGSGIEDARPPLTPPRPMPWLTARVVAARPETPTARTLRLELPRPVPYLAGQHLVVRLTAPDGYTAQRSYSLASAPDGSAEVELTVERLPDGEVSSFLCDVVEPGDELEVRGPIGGWFVWRGDAPALLVGAGSGVVPLMSMLRYARRTGREDLLRLLVSVRRPADLYYDGEIQGPVTTVAYTREAPDGAADHTTAGRAVGRLTAADVAPLLRDEATAYVCGSPGFADAATDLLMAAGVPASAIHVERFGPTG